MQFSAKTLHVMVAASDEAAVKTDLTMLKGIKGASASFLGGFSTLPRLLGEFANKPLPSAKTVLILAETTSGLPIVEALVSLAQKKLVTLFPCLIIAGSAKTGQELKQAGFTTLERPYTQKQLASALLQALKNKHALSNDCFQHKQSTSGMKLKSQVHTKHKASKPVTVQDHYKRGVKLIKENKLDQAEKHLLQAVTRQPTLADGYLALAHIEALRKNTTRTNQFLIRAAAACQRLGKPDKAALIMQHLPEPVCQNNIFAAEALQGLLDHDYRSAAISLLDAARHEEGTPLHSLMSRTCQLTSSPEQNIAEICHALDGMGQKDLSRSLRLRLLLAPEPPALQKSSWLDNYPRLQEVLHVASFATWAWRQA